MAFDPAWPHGHTTREGNPARIICTDRDGEKPIVYLARENGHGNELIFSCCRDGRLVRLIDDRLDLINAPEKVERFVSLYSFGKTIEIGNVHSRQGVCVADEKIGEIKITLIDGKPVSAEIVEA